MSSMDPIRIHSTIHTNSISYYSKIHFHFFKNKTNELLNESQAKECPLINITCGFNLGVTGPLGELLKKI